MWITLFLALLLVENCFTLIDVNIHELQYVSDHLTYNECRRLSAALRLKSWDLPKNVTGSKEPSAPCLVLLLRYDKNQGRGKTVHDLAHRIQQIGRSDVAKRISRMVMHKKAEAIQKDFLDNPFRKMIGITPYLLDNSEDDDKAVDRKKEGDYSKISTLGPDTTENEPSKNTTRNFAKFVAGLTNTHIVLGQVALLSIFLLLITLCIFGFPTFLKKCCLSCTPKPLCECLSDTSIFFRYELVDYLRDSCRRKTEFDAEMEMKEKLLPQK